MKLGGLAVRLTGGSDGSGGGDGPLVVLLHGFGAPGDDLVPLGEVPRPSAASGASSPLPGEPGRVLDAPPGTRFAFPAALHSLPGLWPGARAWWMIDVERYQRAVSTGAIAALTEETPPGLAEARDHLERTLDELQGELSVAGSRIVLGGFSQGSMLALDLALRSDRPLGGLLLWSSTILCRSAWTPAMAARRGLPVHQSHGRYDPILPFSLGQELSALLCAGGMEVYWTEFSGGHEIPPPVVRDASSFLGRVLG
jgi:phospholipase/carboxylesterase